ncbi:MAG TPA: NAD-dependent epimerase/dehydratase family protein [Gemmatimonadota bacterium]|nr:NAD-dependent epimerase/dehydratase family protein [Gemmatimonadota bacterium]
MRVFMTGASGYIGSAVARELVRAGHEVTGLHHSEESVEVVRAAGATPIRGDIADPATYTETASEHDVLIHLAADYENLVPADAAAVDTLIEAARSHMIRDAHLIYTSGCWVLGDTGGTPADEDFPADNPAEIVAWRPAHEERVLGMPGEGSDLTATVIRPGMVYGGVAGLVTPMFASASEEGAARFVGDGKNQWSMVHRNDLATLYLRVVEERASGIFHGVDGSPVRVIDVAGAASEAAGAGGRTRRVPVEEARESLGPAADALLLDQTLVTHRAEEVGWKPAHPSFVEGAGAAWREYRLGEREAAPDRT